MPSPAIHPLRALIFERNKIVARRAARVLGAAGLDIALCETPEELSARLADLASLPDLLFADAFDADEVEAALALHATLRAALWTAEPLERIAKRLARTPRLSSVLGRETFETLPRGEELLAVAHRLSGAAAPPFAAQLAWGARLEQRLVATSAERDQAVDAIGRFVERSGAPRRVAEMMGELAHELLMNALYDAPVDRSGQPLFAHDRKAEIALPPSAAPTLRIGTDGLSLLLQVQDPFGRLTRDHVFGGLERGLQGGEMDRSRGGAGLGMLKMHRSSVALTFDVVPGRSTVATARFELDLNLREFRQLAKSLHYFEEAARPAAI